MTEFQQQVAEVLDSVVMAWANDPHAGDMKNVLIPKVLAPRVAAAIEAACDGTARCCEVDGEEDALRALRGTA